MRAFITGGTGFIGSNLIDYLLTKGIEIFALVRNPHHLTWLEGKNINILEGNLFSIPSLPSDIQYVFHIAGLTKAFKLGDYYTVNQQGTASLFQSLISNKISPTRIVYLSSTAAAGPVLDEGKVKEEDTPHPISPYGKSKLQGEKETLKYSDTYPVTILRAAAVFGPRDLDFLQYFKIIKTGILLSMRSYQGLMNLCYVKDLTRALYLSTQKELKSGEIINIADPRPYSYDELGEIAGRVLEKKLRKLSLPLSIVYLLALTNELSGIILKKPSIFNRYKYIEMKQKSWVVDTKKAEEKLSFRTQHPVEEAIQETLQWYRRQGWL